MGDEHDGWMSKLGVSNFIPSDAGASILSGADKILSGAGDMVKSGAKAAGDVVEAEIDAATGVGALFASGAVTAVSGVAYAARMDDTAKSLRATADSFSDDVIPSFRAAGEALGKAVSEIGGMPPAPAADAE